ncbi:MAG: DUF4982 domain-containing protein [Rikenellaceae bacterium]|jgi:beta-galactosidase|nr:DUF4982 domain-containing protein [Rikenellaceae bacterium]
MKKLFFLSLLYFCCLAASAAGREVVSLNNNWQFSLSNDLLSRATVDLPHTWNGDAINLRALNQRGLGNYIKDIRIPAEWSEKQIYIRFYGVNSEANLFVNGNFVGEHKGGYTAFAFNITPFLKPGESNNLWVRVNNSPQLDYMPINSDFNIYGGIYREVELIAVDPVHFSLDDFGSDGIQLQQTKITDQQARVDALVRLSGSRNGNFTVTVDVTDPETDSVLLSVAEQVKIDKGTGAGRLAVTIPSPRLWQGVFDPYRYEFRLKLKEGANVLDSLAVPMGLRYFEVHPQNGFMLNGRVYPLHGVTRMEDRSGAGSAYSPRMQEEDFALIREMGVNAIRLSNYPQSPYFYELCDRNGVILWSEIPFDAPEFGADNGYINKPAFRENGHRQLTEMILQRYNNTSVLFWGLFSNLSVRGTDDVVPYIQELNRLAHEMDPTRLTIASSNQDGPINFETDLIGWSQYLGWQRGLVSDVSLWLDQLTRNWRELKSGIGEYGAGGSLAHQTEQLTRPEPRGRLHPERWQTRYHEQFYAILLNYPMLWGGFIQTMFDFGEEHYVGGATPGINNFGLVSYDRKDRKDAFYFYKANWNTTDPFVHLAEKRWDNRVEASQTLTVYTNRSEVELFVNGLSLGVQTPVLGICRWENVTLTPGENRIEARANDLTDTARITLQTGTRLD